MDLTDPHIKKALIKINSPLGNVILNNSHILDMEDLEFFDKLFKMSSDVSHSLYLDIPDTLKDYRIKSFRVANFKKFPDKFKDIPYGIDFGRNADSAFLLAGNDSGKTTICSGMEFIYTEKIGEVSLRANYTPGVQDFRASYLSYKSDAAPLFEIDTIDSPLDLQYPLNINSDSFINENSIITLGKLHFEGSDNEKGTLSAYIMEKLGLTKLISLQALLKLPLVKDSKFESMCAELSIELFRYINSLLDVVVQAMESIFDKLKLTKNPPFTVKVTNKSLHISLHIDAGKKTCDPKNYLGNFEFKYLCMNIKIALYLIDRRFGFHNLPLIFDDYFLTADYLNRNNSGLFLKKLILLIEGSSSLPFQYLIFSSDAIHWRSAEQVTKMFASDFKTKTKILRVFEPEDRDKEFTIDSGNNKFWNLIRES